jgi:hypothetical protein
MQINLPDHPLHVGTAIFGNKVSETEFQGALNFGKFKTLVPDPRNLEGHRAKYHADLSEIAALRTKVQRLIGTAKRKNMEQYSRYIIDHAKTSEGFTPQIVLYCQQQLAVTDDPNTGIARVIVPDGLRFIAIDGDTQTAARHEADRDNSELFSNEWIKVVIKHGIPVSQAEQIFADCNSFGVKVTTSLAIGMDTRDAATQLAKYIEQQVPMLAGRVNRQKRQLGVKDLDVLTISALRASIVCFLQGVNGIQNQTKPVEIDGAHAEELHGAALTWFNAATEAVDGALLPDHRAHTFASSPSVWCAIGALGHDTLVELVGENFEKNVTSASLEHAFKATAEAKLQGVDWVRGTHWLSVGAKQSQSGAITLGGPKETGTLVHKALIEGTLIRQPAAAA